MSGWINTEHVDALRALWKTGDSHSKIAAEINRRFVDAAYSRDSVCGKAIRLKLPARLADDPRRAKTLLKIAGRGTVFEEAAAQPPRAELKPEAFTPLPGLEPVPFIERRGRCAWPVGGEWAEMLCCGDERDGEKAYCSFHWDRGHVPTPTPRETIRALRRYA